MSYSIPTGYRFPALEAVRPVMLQNKSSPEYPGVLGSCTMMEFSEKYFIACTRHQLEISQGSEIELNRKSSPLFMTRYVGSQLINIPVVACYFATDLGEEEYHDILLFSVEREKANELGESQYFFPLSALSNSTKGQSLLVGCPSSKQTVNYEPLDITFTTQAVVCRLDQEYHTSSKYLKRYIYDPQKATELDGFSGGAVFSTGLTEGENGTALDGIVTRAGNGFVHVVDANFLIGLAAKL